MLSDVPRWLTERIFTDALKVKALLEDGDTSALKEVSAEEVYAAHREIMFAQETYMRALLASPNLYHLNLHDTDGMSRLVHQLVRLDRLPSMNPPEGLSLLRDAWRDYDVAMCARKHAVHGRSHVARPIAPHRPTDAHAHASHSPAHVASGAGTSPGDTSSFARSSSSCSCS